MSEEILAMRNISKAFGSVQALRGVDFSCRRGEVHVLAGENGAGKSTLLKIISGVHRQDAGSVVYKGECVAFDSPHAAAAAGIAMVYQELTLIGELSVAENIFLNIEPRTRLGTVDRRRMRVATLEAAGRYGIRIDPGAMVKRLSVAQQQMTEILKILVRPTDLIILDEPTSALARQEVEKLYGIIRAMTGEGKSVIFISHRMEEVFAISDRVTVFKDGTLVGTRDTGELDHEGLIRMMVGRELASVFPAHGKPGGDAVFEVRGLDGRGLSGITFAQRRGEILGIGGLEGHGQTRLLNAIAGLEPRQAGEILVNGAPVGARTPWGAIRDGIALVPADRKTEGLSLSLPVADNMLMASLHRWRKYGFVRRAGAREYVAGAARRLSIKMSSPRAEAQSLSGGNQQKVVLGKELAIEPRVVLFNEPTRGIDVESKSEFYRIMRDLADKGVAVIICTGDLMELVGMSDRVVVLYEGRISGELGLGEISEENVMRLAVGVG